MSFDEFIQAFNGKPVDFDGHYGTQCMDLMHYYHYNVLRLTDRAILAAPYAKNLFTNFDNIKGKEHFEKIANTPDAVPQKGDIIIWGEPFGKFTTNDGQELFAGHVAIFIEGDVNNFRSFDANYGERNPHVQEHNYNGVLGWLRFKGTPEQDGDYYQEGDLKVNFSDRFSNIELAKVFFRLLRGELVDSNLAIDPQLLKQQIEATGQCQTQLKTALEQVNNFQSENVTLQEEIKKLKKQYDEEVLKTIALNQANATISNENQDSASKAYSLEKEKEDLEAVVKEIAKDNKLDPNDKNLLNRVMDVYYKIKDQASKTSSTPGQNATTDSQDPNTIGSTNGGVSTTTSTTLPQGSKLDISSKNRVNIGNILSDIILIPIGYKWLWSVK